MMKGGVDIPNLQGILLPREDSNPYTQNQNLLSYH